ncbi:MAG: phosphoribosylformylglycinamidine cyclo-ligase [Planctomycetota bacterium]|jgi:phosphoribosylformylglycinamidine cyclo-ligase
MASKPITYKDAGVDLGANTRWVRTIESAMKSTYGPRVLKGRHGGFAGLFRLDYDEQLFRRNYRKPVLVGCADGVGTKVLLAIQLGDVSTVGIDLVAMNVNDLVTCGAEPLFFLDYLAVNRLDGRKLASVLDGIAAGCRQAGCALLGGETAEMPGMYRPGDFDLAGFSVGVGEFGRLIDGSRISAGDQIVGLMSSGVHSNGYTLVRKLLEESKASLTSHDPELGESLGSALLKPTKIYVQSVLAVLRAYRVKRVVTGMAHITGGGLKENVARVLPSACDAELRKRTWRSPPVYDALRRMGITRGEMFKVFNMGIGYVMFVRPRYVSGVLNVLREHGEGAEVIGKVMKGGGRVRLV